MRSNPTISIIVPVYNDALYIRKCIDSILNQSFRDFEIIIVNDGSSDESGTICDNYTIQDPRVKVIYQPKLGVSSARNKGVEQAQGDYIGFVDGDDYIEKDMYRKLYQACIETGSDISICKLGREISGEIMNDQGHYYTLKLSNSEAVEELFKGGLYRFSLCNKLFHKSCFKGIVFPEGRIHEDLSITYKLFARANRIMFLNFIGYIYVKQEGSILTKSYDEKRLDAFIGWEEIIAYMNQNYPYLSDVVNACFIYMCMDHVYYIIHQVKDKREKRNYLRYIQLYVRNHYKQTIKNSLLPVHYKIIVTFLVSNAKLFMFLHHIKSMHRVRV